MDINKYYLSSLSAILAVIQAENMAIFLLKYSVPVWEMHGENRYGMKYHILPSANWLDSSTEFSHFILTKIDMWTVKGLSTIKFGKKDFMWY